MGELIRSSHKIGSTVPIGRNVIPSNSNFAKDMLLTDLGNYSSSLFSDNFSISNLGNESNKPTSCVESFAETKQTTTREIAVWDCSMCRLPKNKLEKLLFSSNVENAFTSATFNELIKLSKNQTAPTYQQNNAKTVIDFILNNNCTCINIQNSSFSVDQELINYCLERNYTLYSTDYVMCLIAKMFGVRYNYFEQLNSSLNYTCKSETSYILLTESVLTNSIKPEDVLKLAESIGSGKFILTDKFIYSLEANKTPISSVARIWINFFVADFDNSYSSIIDLSETNLSIIDIAHTFDATIICSDITDCFLYKASNCKFKYIDATGSTTTSIQNKSSNSNTNVANSVSTSSTSLSQAITTNVANATTAKSDSANQRLKQTQPEISGTDTKANSDAVSKDIPTQKKLVSIPHLNYNSAILSLRKLSLTESMWVLDEQLHDCKNSYKHSVKLKNNMFVIHIIRKFNIYTLTVYKIVKPIVSSCTLCSSIEYSKDFSKDEVNSIDLNYRTYAIKATLMI